MLRVSISVQLLDGAMLPAYQSEGAAGMDLCANESFELRPFERRLVGTGIRVAIPDGFEGQVRPRSGLALRHGISMVNTPGTIDSDYRGEVRVLLINLGDAPVAFQRGERVGQLVICPIAKAQLQVVATLEDTARGENGFGSTGV